MSKVQIEKKTAVRLMENFEDLRIFEDQLKISNKIEIPYSNLTPDHIDELVGLYKSRGENMNRIALLNALKAMNAKASPVFGEGEFEQLIPALIESVSHGLERGWLFKLDETGVLRPYVVSRIDFTPSGGEESARLVMELKANSCGKLAHPHVIFSERDTSGKSVYELLINKGYVLETPELLCAYDREIEVFFDWRNRFGEQFCASGTGYYAEDPTANQRKTATGQKSRIVLSTSEQPARLVNDEAILTSRDLTLDSPGGILTKLLKRMERESGLAMETDSQISKLADQMEPDLYKQIPVHGYIFIFHLDLHHHLWVHLSHMTLYEYQPDLKDKLVLPSEHVDLIDILTAEMDILMDDIVEGKSGGTTVLCSGPAGVGKTLTAEVYSEIIRRPLYRVHSGQLGLNVAEMETTLKEVLIRAQRWGAIMLIDEADVYIKRRDDNLAMNAVVGVFLRVLEYFNGLLFLTTNRTHDIDEAIISRCIAMIRYQSPSPKERAQIWGVMSAQFNLNLSESFCHDLAERFPKASGRDIKGLAKLVSKFCTHRNVAPDLSVFDHCAIFRGLDLGQHDA